MENNFISFDFFALKYYFKNILENYTELIEKDIPMQNWITYCNIKGLEIVKEKLPEAIDVILSSGNKNIDVNLSENQIMYYIDIMAISPVAEQQVSHAATQHETIKALQLQLPFSKNIIQDKDGNFLLYEMIPGFDPKSLLINHALDCCLVAGGVAGNILPYMVSNPEHCGMFAISKIQGELLQSSKREHSGANDIDIIENLKFKIKELNNICNKLPFDIKDYITINEEIKQMLVDRENMKSNITILGASFAYIKNNSLVFDNIETNNKSFIQNEFGKNIRYNSTTVPFMQCYTEYSKTAMQFNKDIKVSTIGTSHSDIQFKDIKNELANELGFETLSKYIKKPETIGRVYTDADQQIILANREDLLKEKTLKIKNKK